MSCISLVGWAVCINDNILCRNSIMSSSVIAKAEEQICNNSRFASLIPPVIHASCQMLSVKFLLMSIFLFLAWLVRNYVLLILIISFSPSSIILCRNYLWDCNNMTGEKCMYERPNLKSYACAIHSISNSSWKYCFIWPKLLERAKESCLLLPPCVYILF